MNRINVTAKKWKWPPFFQAMLLSMIPLTKSNTHSMKFCFPVGRFFKFRVQTIAKIKVKDNENLVDTYKSGNLVLFYKDRIISSSGC